LMASFSRLVIDPNRGERDPTLIMRLYDRSVVPANRAVDAAERERRLNAYHRPYRRAVEAAASNAERALGAPPLLVAIHSFTPALRGRPRRPWHVGVLWDSDPATAQELLARLRACGDLIIGDNEPYKGSLPGDMMWTLGGARRPHALIEIRNDLIEEPRAQAAWAARLAPILLQIGASSDGATAASRRDLATTPPHAGASPSVGALVNQHAPEPARADASWDDASW
ncbi:MAG: N-formylglutamate amidohydrolase, partial [Pseudomonadota bacterium]